MSTRRSSDRPRRQRRRTLKVVVTGPFDAGKTTFIRTISEITVLSTERPVSGDEEGATTTVALDFGRIRPGRDLALHLFGTPGQDRFEFMWDILAEGMLGFVVLVDGTRPRDDAAARRIEGTFAALDDVPHVVAVNKTGGQVASTVVAEVRDRLQLAADTPILLCDARDREDVKRVLVALLEQVRERIRATPPGPLATLRSGGGDAG
jgi:uncharacterized protein